MHGREEWPFFWKLVDWFLGCGETDKSLKTSSAELWKAVEGNSKNRQYGAHIHMQSHGCGPAKCFPHELSFILNTSKNVSDVIYQ